MYVLMNIYFLPTKLAGSKKSKVFAKNKLQSNEITKFCESIHCTGCQKVSKSDHQSKFSKAKIIWIFLIFVFHSKNTCLGA